MITDKYDESLAKINYELSAVKATAAVSRTPANASDADWKAACDAAFEEVKAALDAQLAKAYQLLGAEEQRAAATGTGILGYEFTVAGTGDDGYVLIADAIKQVDIAQTNLVTADNNLAYWDDATDKFKAVDAGEPTYDATLAKAIAAIKAYNLDQFAKDDKVTHGGVTKSSYEWAVEKQSDALAYLGALKGYQDPATIGGQQVTCTTAVVESIYKINNAGTVGEEGVGRFFTGATTDANNATIVGVTKTLPAMSELKTTATLTTDTAKIEYAKSKALSAVKAAIEAQRAKELAVENQTIFTQSVATKPNQKLIDEANKNIKHINEKYDAMVKVWEYRLTNAEYKIEKYPGDVNEYVNAYYDDARYYKLNSDKKALAYYTDNAYRDFRIYIDGVTIEELNPLLSAETDDKTDIDAMSIIKLIGDLEDEAAALKATIAVDGSTYIDVDEALKDAIDKAYMTGAATLDQTYSATAVHMNAHKLLGDNCAGTTNATKVTLNGKSYDNISQWVENTDAVKTYSPNNNKAVKAIKKEAKAAVKAAATVEEANKAFLDAYAKYDAVLTKADQAALFAYNGALYKKDEAAKSELKAYIDYKVALMDDVPNTDTAAAVKEYFNLDGTTTYVNTADKDDFLAEVVDEASLNAAIAKVKETVDSLKTKAELKSEGAALVKEANAVKRGVKLEQKAEVLALYDKLADYATYCDMVNYGDTTVASKALVAGDIASLEDLELAELEAAKKALGDVDDITLANEDAVKAFVAAEEAYNELYGAKGTYKAALTAPADYDEATAYDNKIFELKVKAAEALVKALPVNASAKDVKAARAAVDALGFKGICKIRTNGNAALLTKLNKFEQDATYATIIEVESLKIKASSTAKKGSITVKWKVTGDTSAVQYYEIRKSTKLRSGFGTKPYFKTTKKTYKNTKELKKGTRYYYKVRAVAVIDGVKYTSDWSNKAYRIAK